MVLNSSLVSEHMYVLASRVPFVAIFPSRPTKEEGSILEARHIIMRLFRDRTNLMFPYCFVGAVLLV